MRLAQRLTALETIWPEPDQMVTEGDIGSLGYWSSPVAQGILLDWCGLRAHYRHQHTHGGNWWQLARQERDAAVQFEVDEFTRLLTLLGDDEGYEAWHDQAAHWHGQHGPADRDTFEARLRHGWTNADGNRGHPSSWLFRQTWPEWRPGMSDDESLAFDLLLARERSARLTPYFPKE
jgi:hypothetical protein